MKEIDGYRYDVLRLLDQESGAIGIELGVAAGGFSKRMVDSGRFDQFFGVDMYADTHDTEQYKLALRTVGIMKPYKLLRMTFDEAFDLFEDESLDFIYVDGYAGSGQDGGDTIYKWAQKVRVGGVIAGDDFHDDWPLVQAAVHQFVADTGFDLHVTTKIDTEVAYADYPSWAVVKSTPVSMTAPAAMVAKGRAVGERMHAKKSRDARLRERLKRIVGPDRMDRLRAWNRNRRSKR